MNVLEQIIAHKKLEVEERKKMRPVAELEKGPFFKNKTASLKRHLLDPGKSGIIAEFKRRSPSKGVINDAAGVVSVTKAYTAYGASGLSILTDQHFFGGSLDDLYAATVNAIPILQKDFTVDEYQLIEGKSWGAEVILLIAACLSPARVKQLAATAKQLGLEVLLELHEEKELEHICDGIDLVGVNNRDLKTFAVDLDHSVRLGEKIGSGFIKIAESGINDIDNINYLKQFGFKGFLVGEHFMKQKDPGQAFKDFAGQLK